MSRRTPLFEVDGSIDLPDVPKIKLPPHPDAGEVLMAGLAKATRTMVTRDPLVRFGEDEALHGSRVSARRMHSQLRTFRPLFEEAWVNELRRELKWLVDVLGVPRDLDVTLERLRMGPPLAGEATPRRLQTAIGALEEAREKAGAELLAALRSPRYLALLDRLVDVIHDPPLTDEAGAPAMDVLPPMVHKSWKRLRSRVDRLGPSPSHRELHRIRIEAKKVRYAAEALIPVAGKPARAFAKRAVALQDALGDARDGVLVEAWLRNASGQIEMDDVVSLRRPEDEPWRTAWDELNRKKLRSWLRG